MPHLLHHDNNDNNHQPGENRVKKILSHVNVSSILPQRISFHKSASEKSAPSTARSSSSSASSASVSSESKEVIHADGFQEPKRILFPKAKVQALLAWQSTPGAGAGLNNHGNTCFLNSVVQCISYTPPLANYLLSREHSRSCKTVGFCMMCILEKHVTRALSNSGSISPSEIVQNLRKIAPGFRPGRQEDAHEFLRFVVENAQKSCLGPLLKDKSITPREAQTTLIGNIFGGYLQSQVKCSECNYESNTYDPFMDLSVDLGDKVDTLNAALTKFIKPEILDAKNMYMCSKCKKRVRAQKRMRIYQAPPILTIQLKRFSFFQMFGGKINRPIKFDAKLNLDPYMVKPCPEGSNVYNLYGVLVHLGGSTNSGHYYSFIKAPNGDWYQMDDQSVSKVSLGLVLQQKAYILFYARSPSPTGRSTTPTKTAPSPSPSPSLSSSSVSVSSTPVSPSSSSHLNGQRRDPNSKTSGADPKDKANGKPTLPMSNLQQRSLYQQQQKQQQQEQQEQQQQQQVTATTNTTTSTINSIKSPSPQRRILQQQQQQQQQQQDTHLQEKQSTTTTILPRALRIQQQQQLKQQLKLQQQQQQQKQQNESLPSPSEENTAILLSHPSQLNGTSHNDKRKRKNEETLLGEKKKRKIDHSILAINCIFSVRDIEPQNDDSEKVDKIEKKAQKQKTQKEQKTSEEIKQVKSDSVITPTPTETSAEKKEKKKAAKKAKKAERKKAKQAEKAKEADKVKATEKTKDTDIWRNFFDEAANTQNNDVVMNGKHSENEKMNGKTENGKMNGKTENGKMNGKHENGKVNGKHENGKVNGKHENGKMNGKHENGKTENGHMNGKTENGKVNGKTENGKMNGKSHSIDMWKRKEREEEAKETETKEKEEKEVTKNGKHSKGAFGAPKFTVSDGIPVTQAKEMAQNFLKTMELVRDNSNVFGTTVESWDSEDAVAAAEIRKKKNNDKQAKVDRMFQDRDEWDIEYDMGKQKKVKTYDLFDNNHNLFQSLADHRANTKN